MKLKIECLAFEEVFVRYQIFYGYEEFFQSCSLCESDVKGLILGDRGKNPLKNFKFQKITIIFFTLIYEKKGENFEFFIVVRKNVND